MSELVERVARALCTESGMPPDYIHYEGGLIAPDQPFVPKDPKPNWTRFVKEARAALSAMREPTDAMLDAGWKGFGEGEECEPVWQAMIDAALK